MRAYTTKISHSIKTKPKLKPGQAKRLINSTNQSDILEEMNNRILIMRKRNAKPAGCSFLGSKATEAIAKINDLQANPISVILDSGSDITLISESEISKLRKAPKIRIGQRINLIQVTGKASINGYATIDLIFETIDGPVIINVEAYIVKGMTTPFILGNDFAEQYLLSLVRTPEATRILFGQTGRYMDVQNSSYEGPKDKEGRTFKVLVRPDLTSRLLKTQKHKQARRTRDKMTRRFRDQTIRSAINSTIPPHSIKRIPIHGNFRPGNETLLVERQISSNRGPEEAYGIPETLVHARHPYVFISNFAPTPITIGIGQRLGRGISPEENLRKISDLEPHEIANLEKHAHLIQGLVKAETSMIKATVESINQKEQKEDELGPGEMPVEGGPKTAETPVVEILKEEEELSNIDISKDLSEEQQTQLRELLQRRKGAFGCNGRLGNHPGEVEVPLKEGTKPISIPPFIASPAKREVIDKQMDAWLRLDVIEASKSPWAAPVFIVYRNGKPRMVIDLRRLNDSVIPDEFPLPRQEDILQTLQGSQYLSTLDALAGFTQLSIKPSDREKLAFRSHRGLYQFKRMPFGFRNGPAVFQRIMQGILAPYLWIFALVYIDDIVIFSKTFEDHLTHIDKVLGAIQEAKITLSPSKCHFAYQSLLLLGQKVSRLGLSTHKEKIEAIVDLASPRNVNELQKFLGMMVYFSSYVPFYAWIVHPLFQLTKKSNKWVWTENEQRAFDLCKQVLTQAPVRAHAIPGRPYRIYSDACDFALAAILQQVQPIKIKDLQGTKVYERLERAYQAKEPVPVLCTHLTKEGSDVPESDTWSEIFEETTVHIERVIAYWSRVLQPAERNYSPTEREALALKEGLIKFQPYLEGEKIFAITDHAALTWSKTFQNVNRRLLSWGLTFSAFPNMHIIHRAGRVHSNVDPISRLRRRVPHQEGPNNNDLESLRLHTEDDPLRNMFNELGHEFEHKLLTVSSHFINSSKCNEAEVFRTEIAIEVENRTEQINYQSARNYAITIVLADEEKSKWVAEYRKDPYFCKILTRYENNKESDQKDISQFEISNDNLMYFIDNLGNSRLCVPKGLQNQILNEIHNEQGEAAHSGYFKTYNRISNIYYWPKMSRDVKRFVLTCDVCQKIKPRKHAPVGLLQSIAVPDQPFQVVTMDFIPWLPESNGFNSILVIVDKLTKYGIFIPVTMEMNSEHTARLFFKHVIAKFGIPRQVISDRDPKWSSDFWKEICRLMGMTRSLTTAYHPQADGQTEVLNHNLEVALRAYIGPSRNNWSELLDVLALSYNTNIHTATNFAPAYLLRGYHPLTGSRLRTEQKGIPRPMNGSSGEPPSKLAKESVNLNATQMVEGFEAERRLAQDTLLIGQYFQRKYYNQGRSNWQFEEGDWVVLNQNTLGILDREKGNGKKFLIKYDGPFQILEKLSPVAYRIRLPASYGMHPVLNIAHLERYNKSPPEFGERPTIKTRHADFDEQKEWEVEKIVDEEYRKSRNGRMVQYYKLRYVGFSPDDDTWEPRKNIRNAPEILRKWEEQKKHTNLG